MGEWFKMLEGGKISPYQFMLIVIMFTVGTSILLSPTLLAGEAKQDAWIAAIVGTIAGILIVWMFNTLAKKFPNKTLIEYTQIILGKWIGKVISLLFLSVPFILASLSLRNIGDFLTTQIMPETPIQTVHFILLTIVVMGARLGIEALSRSAEIFFPWFLLLFIILVLFVSPEIKMENIHPLFENGLNPILKATIPFISFPFLELIILLMVFPYVHRIKDAEKAFLIGTLIGGSLLIVLTLLSILVLGADTTVRHLYPTYVLAQKINVGNFLQRIEAIVAGMWFISIFYKLSLCLYTVALGVAQIFNLRTYRPLTFPLAMILLVFSLVISPNIVYNITVTPRVWTPHLILFSLALPLLLLGVASIIKRS